MTKNKKILIITECFYPEEFKINDIALSWRSKGYDIDVLTLNPTYPLGVIFSGYKNKLFQQDMYQGIRIFRLYSVTGYKNSTAKKILRYVSYMVLGSLFAVLIGKRYEYVFGFNLGSLTDMLPATLIRRFYKKPVMFWVQDVWPDSVYAYGFKKTRWFSVLLDIFVKFIYQSATSIAISSKGFESKLKPYIKKDLKFVYAPNWADDLDMDLEPINLSTTPKTHFTFAGNVGKVQNLENIIKAFCLLSCSYQERSQLNIVGDGSNLIKLKQLANDSSNVIFYGKQIRENMSSFYKASDFLIVSLIDKPIFSVTVPAKTQTYIAAKKPILAIINGDVANIVNDNKLGVCANPSDINHIKKTFERCIDMSEDDKLECTINNERLLKTTFNKDVVIGSITSQLINQVN